ncbi:hypothetical protein KOR34_28610 [Posidoniimonas corsicana]|uniref:DUF3618 domain-containing protein n=1 Tax=Posidoniimonas corsicana TaxID=1938618 RepID=A0A5C5VJB4_9BACT|nr:hypothetical protein [Posidoniimonas corsicana]TWT37895.1 hypothetical protein KOR34_28610 [Posidoniimonas corsicana]
MAGGNHHGRFGMNGNGHASPDQLAERMDRVRRDLQRDVAQLSEDARQVTDWRYYVRRHPLATAGLAALVGYSLIPAKKKVVQASRDDIESLVRQGKLKVVAEGQTAQKAGVVSASLLALGTVATRAFVAYAGKRLGERLEASGSPFGPAPSE